MDAWNPDQYEKFKREREQPFFDLLDLVRPPARPDTMRVVDLGCGTGRLTKLLHERLHARETLGLDRSARMLEPIMKKPPPPGLRFEVREIESFDARAEYDLVISNAALHWVDDHASLIPRLAAALVPGGQLAFQVPAMHDTVTHKAAHDVSASPEFRDAFAGWTRRPSVLTPDQYARLLYRTGFPAPIVRLAVYPHVLPSRDAAVEWVKGTLLTDFEKRLTPDRFAAFLEAYRARVLPALEDTRPFFFPFQRILCWGQKPSS